MWTGQNLAWQKIADRLRALALFGTPCVAVALLAMAPPADLSPEGWQVAVFALWMAAWWMTEAVPLAVTALLPLVAFPFAGILPIEKVSASYAHPLIFLFLGGFMLARAMERWGLHRHLAGQVIRIGGASPGRVIASLMAVTAFLSMWISNTATAMVMLPIGQSLTASPGEAAGKENKADPAFGAALMLGIAYSATIGGMGSLIGTPPNALFAGYMETTYGIEIGFARWMLFGVPVVLVLLPITWLLLTKIAFRIRGQAKLPAAATADFASGSLVSGEKRVAVIVVAVALMWLFRPVLEGIWLAFSINDAAIAIAGAMLLFVVPAGGGERRTLLNWREAAEIRWDILILFGGGLALAAGIVSSGLADWIGNRSLQSSDLPPLVLTAVFLVTIVYLGELASNTAMAAIFLPIAGALAVGMGAAPVTLLLPIAIGASLGFMLPVATPPNAIVFGSGAVNAGQMLRAGAFLDIIGICVVLTIGTLLGPVVFGGVG